MPRLPEDDAHTKAFLDSLRENGGMTPVEADERLNNSARDLIAACIDRWGGSAFVGVFNDYDPIGSKDPACVLRILQAGEMVCTFSCDFAVPTEDQELIHRVLAFRSSPSMARIEAVSARVKALGGVLLNWS